MTTTVERQAGMDLPPGLSPRLIHGYRAVCDAHGTDSSGLIQNWMGTLLRDTWIGAKLDALDHDLTIHSGVSQDVPEQGMDLQEG